MRSIINKLAIIIIAFGFVTTAAIAADYDPNKGTVVVNVADGNGTAIPGNWYLHQFNINGTVPRNGSSGETFQIASGTYYLEARLAGIYKAYWLKSTNPQSVSAGQTITFDLAYYATQEAKEIAQSQPQVQAEEPVVEPVVEEATEPVVEEAVTETAAEESSSGNEPVAISEVPTFETPPNGPVFISDVPTFETPPSASPADESYELGAVTSLAQTGPAAIILLIPSSVAGLWFALRRKK